MRLLDAHTCAKGEACKGLLVNEVEFGTPAVVVTEGDIEPLALRHDLDGEDSVAEHHVVPRDVVRDDVAGSGTLVETRPFVVQIPGLHVMYLHVETQRRMLDAVGETELEVERQHLMVRTAFIGVEAFDLPTDILQHETHLEGRVARLEMRTDVCADGEGGVGLVDGIDGLECHTDFEHRTELARVHDVNKDIACAERPTGKVAVLVRVFHPPVVEVMNADSEIVGFVGLAVSFVGFLDGRATEVMTVEHGAEHGARQVIGEVEFQFLMRIRVQQGGVAHAERDVSVAERSAGTTQGVDARRDGKGHEGEHRITGIRHLRMAS